VLESALLVNSPPLGPGYTLSWSLPPTLLGTPDGGYDIVTDGVDDNDHRTTEMQIEITDFNTSTEHCFAVQARWTQTGDFPVSNEMCVPPMESTTPPPEEPEPPSGVPRRVGGNDQDNVYPGPRGGELTKSADSSTGVVGSGGCVSPGGSGSSGGGVVADISVDGTLVPMELIAETL